ncbi:MAG: tetratricopeptide repeat protein [Ekhidna sp.]
MRDYLGFLLLFSFFTSISQDHFDKARICFQENKIDSARFYINKALQRNPNSEEYFLSGMIHEVEGKDLRAAADYEAVIKKDPENIEAYFQKGLIYYNSSSLDQAIKDFTYVIDHQGSETKAVYYSNDPFGIKGTYVTTLASIVGRVYQFRGLAYQKSGKLDEALSDFNTSFEYDTIADFYINRGLFILKS